MLPSTANPCHVLLIDFRTPAWVKTLLMTVANVLTILTDQASTLYPVTVASFQYP